MKYAYLALLVACLCGFIGFGIMADMFPADLELFKYSVMCALMAAAAGFCYMTERNIK